MDIFELKNGITKIIVFKYFTNDLLYDLNDHPFGSSKISTIRKS